MRDSRRPLWRSQQLRARPPDRSANHIPDDDAVNSLSPFDDVARSGAYGFQTKHFSEGLRQYSCRCVQITNSCAWGGRSKIVVLLPSRQPFSSSPRSRFACIHPDAALCSHARFDRGVLLILPIVNESMVLHVVQHMTNEFALWATSWRKIARVLFQSRLRNRPRCYKTPTHRDRECRACEPQFSEPPHML